VRDEEMERKGEIPEPDPQIVFPEKGWNS